MKFWIAAAAKMEELYIREWIEWHKNIGVDHILIADNNDSNYEIPLQPIIQDYVDEGYVEIIDKKDQLHVQQPFYSETYKTRKNEFDWIAFIDIDEFIELPAYDNDIHKFLDDKKFKDTDTILISWKKFDDNDNLYYEDKPVKERFTRISKWALNPDKTVTIKTFYRSLEWLPKICSHHHPLTTSQASKFGHILTYCDVLGNTNFDASTSSIIFHPEYWETAYLSHYITKSTEEYIKYKSLRGRGDRAKGKYSLRYSISFYAALNNMTPEKRKMFNQYNSEISNFQQNILQRYNGDQNEEK